MLRVTQAFSYSQKLSRISYGWWIVAASFLVMLINGGVVAYGFTAFFNPILEEFPWSRAAISFGFSLRSMEGGIAQPVAGFLVDRFGPRRLIFFGVAAAGAGLILMSFMQSLWYFYAAFSLVAIGTSAGFGMPQYAAIASWFTKRRSLAMGILSASYGFSGIMAPMLVWFIAQYGWRWTIALAGLTLWVVGIPSAFVVKHKPRQDDCPPDSLSREAILDKDVVRAKLGDDTAAAVLLRPPKSTHPGERPHHGEFGLSPVEVLKTRAFWLLIFFVCFSGFAESAINVHLIPHLTNMGVSREVGAFTMAGVTLSSLIGRVGFAWLGDRFNKRYLMAVATVLKLIGVLIFTYMRQTWLVLPFLLTYGPGFGAPIPLTSAMQADYFGLRAFGSIRGLISVGWTVASIIGPLVAGRVFDLTGSYQLAFIIFSAAIALSIPAILAATSPKRANR